MINKKIYSIIFTLLCLGGASSRMSGQVIATESNRQEFLESAGFVINNSDYEVNLDETLDSPFFMEEIQSVDKAEEVVVVKEETKNIRLPDSSALEIISRQFNPTGSLILANKGYLQLPGGQKMALGSVFTATIQNEDYRVRISDITSDGYKLRLGEAEQSMSFLSKSPKNTITSSSSSQKSQETFSTSPRP